MTRFANLLVPLDGSASAEAALPPAQWLCAAAGGSVTLLHLLELRPPQGVHGERHLRDAAEAESYLRGAAARFARDAAPRCHVHAPGLRNVTRGLLDHLRELGADTVVMSVHGERAMRTLLRGNMAQKLVSQAGIPVFLIRPPEGPAAGAPFAGWRRILVPHDASASHDTALPAALELARLGAGALRLVMAVPTVRTLEGAVAAAGSLMPRAQRALLDIENLDAARHLKQHLDEIRREDIEVTTEVCRSEPARCIVEAAARFGADLVVMASHGRAGTEAFWAGSVAARVCGRCPASMLFVPARAA